MSFGLWMGQFSPDIWLLMISPSHLPFGAGLSLFSPLLIEFVFVLVDFLLYI